MVRHDHVEDGFQLLARRIEDDLLKGFQRQFAVLGLEQYLKELELPFRATVHRLIAGAHRRLIVLAFLQRRPP